MKKLLPILLVFLVFASVAHAEQLNAKTLDSVDLEIVQSGSLLMTGFTNFANLSYYIPQEGVQDVKVTADGDMTWKYTNDAFGNRLILIEWTKLSGLVNYKIEMTVQNTAKHVYGEKQIGTNDLYLKPTRYIVMNDQIRQLAFPYEKTLKHAADLTAFVYNYIDYDLSYVGKNVPSDQVLIDKRGVCVEHANLLAALLRASGIPTRYVVGYAYSSVQNKFVGHTWVEVLAADGTWVPFDPTWLEGGYLDATHIKSAVLLDNSQIDTLTYLGGDIQWTRNEESIKLLNYREKAVTGITTAGTDRVSSQNYGYIKGTVSTSECTIAEVKASSCVNNADVKQFEIYDEDRYIWTCGMKDVYWFFKTSGNNYICPVSVYDQTGGQTEFRVTVQGQTGNTSILITGPDTAKVGETFTLKASTDGIFYSPDFGLAGGREVSFNIKKPGTYKFYLYYFGSLYVKTVNVVQIKEFDLKVAAPSTVNINQVFQSNITIKNIGGSGTANIEIDYTNQTVMKSFFLDENEEKNFSVSFIANRAGQNQFMASATGNSIITQTAVINTPEEEGLPNIFKSLGDFFAGLIAAISSFFSNK